MNLRGNPILFLVAVFLVHPAADVARAQVHPADMRSGSIREFGTAPITIFTVPGDAYFVLTDIVWSTGASPGIQQAASCNLYGNGVERWRIRGNYIYDGATSFQSVPFQTHFSTGLAFTPGEVVTFESTGHAAGSYSLVWSGYVVPTTPSGIEPDSPNSPSSPERILGQNEPNPFGQSTLIPYELPSPAPVEISVFDSQGRKVRTLVEGAKAGGQHGAVWDGRNDEGVSVASGVYFYEFRTPRGAEQRKAILLR